jgi:cation diffusion facilitator CzcD-associated flavoprotein CzcO
VSIEHLDVLVVGAGISGIAAGYHLQTQCPAKSFAIVESRSTIGGTWDLFRYPGARSDSDIFTLGYSFKPWTGRESIAGAPAIMRYLSEAAHEQGIDKKIRFGQRLTRAAWDSASARWTVELDRGEGLALITLTCNFLFMCTGYFSYSNAYRPRFPGEEDFQGRIVHPQFWPADLDYRDKRVVVIGSGATAVTLIPALAGEAGHVTMLQRSPTYIFSRPGSDWIANGLRKLLPATLAHRAVRFKFIVRDMLYYNVATRLPWLTKKFLLGLVNRKLKGGHDVAKDFTPRYPPWDQRLCLVPDGDLFDCINRGRCSIETGEIDRITAGGIQLKSGKQLPADLIIAATGLQMELMSGVELSVDGVSIALGETFGYKGCMYSGVPNLASSFGYANASWTLKAELICAYVCRLLTHMEHAGQAYCVPLATGIKPTDRGPLNLNSGYVRRALASMPKQGRASPWKTHHNYALDLWSLRYGRLDDGAMRFVANREDLAIS